KEKALLFRFLSNDVHLTTRAFVGWETVDDSRPALAAVVRAIDVVLFRRGSSSAAEPDVREHVGRVDVVVSGLNSDEVGVRRQIGEVRDVIPGPAAIHRVVDLSRAAA